MAAQFIIVTESGLSASAYGAKITTSDILDEHAALELFDAIARGAATDLYEPFAKGVTVRVSDRQLLDISKGRGTSTKQTRITLTEVLSDRR